VQHQPLQHFFKKKTRKYLGAPSMADGNSFHLLLLSLFLLSLLPIRICDGVNSREDWHERINKRAATSQSDDPFAQLDVNVFLKQAHLLKEEGVREQHRNTLRAYQTGKHVMRHGLKFAPYKRPNLKIMGRKTFVM
jgi:hypothetical protein